MSPTIKSPLYLDWCSQEASPYAVENWHYSRHMPSGKIIRIGVWEFGKFVGTVIFGQGANPQIGKPFSLEMSQICELVRVAMKKHQSPVTKVVAIALRMLNKKCPGIELVISYADEQIHGHIGRIYQAGNWIYMGKSTPIAPMFLNGVIRHNRTVSSRVKTTSGIARGKVRQKHKYLMPLNDDMRKKVEKLRKEYPKSV